MRELSPIHRTPVARLGHLLLLLLPLALLVVLAFSWNSMTLGIAAVVALIVPVVFMREPSLCRPPVSGPIILYYLASLGVIWIVTRTHADALAHVSRGVLFLVATGLVASHDLFRTGAEPRRRARKWCARLQAREHWPADLKDVRQLSEVIEMRDAATVAPGPVFDLFHDARPEVRAAAFAAFHKRSVWRPREISAVIEEVRRTKEPEVRVVALSTLGSIDDPLVTSALADFFHDEAAEVRAAAVWSAIADGGRRWGFVRDSVRALLSDQNCPDTALPGVAGHLPVVAICDLTTWSAEPEPLGTRSVKTLVDHYGCVLQTTGDYDLITDLTNQVLDPGTSTVLRVELATLLRNLGLLTPELLDRMTNADQPGPVRLLAAEAMLMADPYHPDGLDVLRGLGRQPNREVALTIAAILQNRLGLDLGLPPEGLASTSRAAGDVVKKVMAWAVARGGDRRSGTPTPGILGSNPLAPATPESQAVPELAYPNIGPPARPSKARRGPW